MKTITVAGKLGRDAETRQAGKDTVTSFSVAVDEKRGAEKTTYWFECSIWGRRGEALAQYLTRGSSVAVAGEFGVRTYTTKDGDARTSLTVRVDQITLQGGRDSGHREQQPRPSSGHRNEFDDRNQGEAADYGDDDIPF